MTVMSMHNCFLMFPLCDSCRKTVEYRGLVLEHPGVRWPSRGTMSKLFYLWGWKLDISE